MQGERQQQTSLRPSAPARGRFAPLWKSPQLRQTIISTGSVGAFFGAVPTLAWVSSRSWENAFPHGWNLAVQAFELLVICCGSIAFCVLIFGLIPMFLQYVFVSMVCHWTGRP